MEPSLLRIGFSAVLKKYGIDNLALEMELTEVVLTFLKGQNPARTAESTRNEIAKAIQDGKSDADIRMLIHATIINDLSVNPSDKDGEEFIEFAYLRAKIGEDISTFVKWWLANNPDPKFWSFARMKMMWPQAFKRQERYVTPIEDKRVKKGAVPAPEEEG
jgi:hypothetical protein